MTSREDIVHSIKTALEGITIANGFAFDITTVEKRLRDFNEVGQQELPYLGVAMDHSKQTTYEYQATNLVRKRFAIAVLGHVDSVPGASRLTKISNLEDAVLRRLHVDFRREQNAIDTQIKSANTDEGDSHNAARKPTGSILFDIEVSYLTNLN